MPNNLTDADVIIVSHGHYDHTGGLNSVLNIASKAVLYIHPEALKTRYSKKENNARMIGMSDSTKQTIQKLADKKRVVWTEMPTEISQGLFITSKIPRNTDYEDTGGSFFVDKNCQNADDIRDDQAIFFESNQGLIVIVGCAHSGVVNTLDYVTKMTNQNNVYAVAGGMHLVNANSNRIERTIEAFKNMMSKKLYLYIALVKMELKKYK